MELEKVCNNLIVYNNGQEALDGLSKIFETGEDIPEIIFLDLNMPIMDGWEFLEKFVNPPDNDKILIYIVTSSIDPSDLSRAKNYENVSNYIVKPILSENLNEVLKDLNEQRTV